MMLKIFKFLKRNLGLFLFIFVLLNFNSVSLANTTTDAALNGMSSTLSMFFKFFQIFLYPILFLTGALMDNSLLFGPGAEDRLLEIWSYVRNLINLLLGVGLVAIAIYNISGLDADGNYGIKTVLPKIGLALVLINFSYVGAKIILDVTNVLTTTAFSLPNTVMGTQNNLDLSEICKGMNAALQDKQLASVQGTLQSNVSQLCGTDGVTPTDKLKEYLNGTSANNLAFIMATNFGLINQASNVNNLVISVPSLLNLGINAIVSTILLGVNFIVYLILFLVVVGRFIILYILISVSPLVVLSMVMSGSLPDSISSLLNGLFDDFLSNATAPIVIGLGLSVSYMMFDAMVKIGNVNTLAVASDFQAVFPSGIDIHQFVIGIASAYVVFKAADAAKDNTLVAETVRPLTNFVTDSASTLKNLPTSVPLVRTPNGKQISMQQGLNDIGSKIKQAAGIEQSTEDSSKLKQMISRQMTEAEIKGLNKSQMESILKDGTSINTQNNKAIVQQLQISDPRNKATYQSLLTEIEKSENANKPLKEIYQGLSEEQQKKLFKALGVKSLDDIGSSSERL